MTASHVLAALLTALTLVGGGWVLLVIAQVVARTAVAVVNLVRPGRE